MTGLLVAGCEGHRRKKASRRFREAADGNDASSFCGLPESVGGFHIQHRPPICVLLFVKDGMIPKCPTICDTISPVGLPEWELACPAQFFCLPFFCQPGWQAKRWQAKIFGESCRGRIRAIRPKKSCERRHQSDTPRFHGMKSSCPSRTAAGVARPLATSMM